MTRAAFSEKIDRYIHALNQEYQSGRATEHSYRSYFKDFIESVVPEVRLMNEPKQRECGAPDYVVTRGRTSSAPAIGFIETKDLGVSLEKTLQSKQIVRYRSSLNSLLVTNYVDFVWLYRGKEVARCEIGDFKRDTGVQTLSQIEFKAVREFFQYFAADSIEPVAGAQELASRMAGIARLLKTAILESLADEDENGDLKQQLQSFREYVLHELDELAFADMYAQTLCYGLLAARYHHDSDMPFARRTARLPRTNPFLRWLFEHVSKASSDSGISWLVDDLATLLRDCNVPEILDKVGRSGWRQDPVVHFYEQFLSEYDATLRVEKGVFYTPDPIVKYIVNSVDHLLRTTFKIAEGLADATKFSLKRSRKRGKDEFFRVNILDPACGTGTFLMEVVNKIHQYFEGNEGYWREYISKALIPRIFGFEILMAPYTIAHLKVAHAIGALDQLAKCRDRLNIILTNTLEKPYEYADLPLFKFAREVADEVNAASEVKLATPVMVVLGNPPYRASSENKCPWINGLLRGNDSITKRSTDSYFHIDGKSIGERNPKWLNDDYVKFIRFGQWRIKRTGSGVLAFVTNHMFLTNPTFRGMRKSLLDSFDDIYILNLHGSSKLSEKCPDGSKDENVFDIQQGVCIALFVKRPRSSKQAIVLYSDLWGLRSDGQVWINDKVLENHGKYEWLESSALSTTPWIKVRPKEPFYRLDLFDDSHLKEYQGFHSLKDIFPTQSTGITTARDGLTVGFSRNEMQNRLRDFLNHSPEIARQKFNLRPGAREWKVNLAQEDLESPSRIKQLLTTYAYRPFDSRYTVYTGRSRGFHCRPRFEVMQHLREIDNVAFLFTRQVKGEPFHHAFVSRNVVDSAFLTVRSGSRTRVAPLLTVNEDGSKRLNICKEFLRDFEKIWGKQISTSIDLGNKQKTSVMNLLGYIYAVLWTPQFCQRYQSLLVNDYPRIPMVSDSKILKTLAQLGLKLVHAHLEGPRTSTLSVTFPIEGSGKVETVKKENLANGRIRIFINRVQFFEFKNSAVPDFFVGGNNVCMKWLQDRKGRQLSFDEITSFLQMGHAVDVSLDIISELERFCQDSQWLTQ